MELSGKIVLSSGISVDFDIWSYDFASDTLSQLTHGDNYNDFPTWSPDGSKIAYVCTEEDLIPSLWTMDSNGTNKVRLTNHVFCEASSWHPDGTRILFVSNFSNREELDVTSIKPDGSDLRLEFSYKGKETSPRYSPTGETILFSAEAPESKGTLHTRDTDIIEYHLDKKSFHRLSSHEAKDNSPRYSPDRSQIAFISSRNDKSSEEYQAAYAKYLMDMRQGTNAQARAAMETMRKFEGDGDVFVMSADGSNIRQLTFDNRSDSDVCWSPCGKFLMYTSSPRGSHESARINVIQSDTGQKLPFRYDRSSFEREIGSDRFLDRKFFLKLMPNFIERRLHDSSLWGEERRPDWR